MADYLEVNLVSKDKKDPEKSRWTRVGAAFPNEKIGGWRLVFDHAITAVPGVTDILLSRPKPKDEGI